MHAIHLPEFVPEPFEPPVPLRGPHRQTLYAWLIRRPRAVRLNRLRIDTPDGDFLDLDFAEGAGRRLPPTAPVVLLLHGLEGSARSLYAVALYRQLAAHGFRSIGMNYRSCSGEPNRRPRFYTAGATDDVALVHQTVAGLYPDAPIGMVGVSLGANLLLKYLGAEDGLRAGQSALRAAVAVSPLFDMERCSRIFDEGSGRRYAGRLLRSLKHKLTLKRALLAQTIDMHAALRARTVRDFDTHVTAPLNGYRDAADYYGQNSCGPFLGQIATPTLIMRAVDDPFFDPLDIPRATLAQNPHITAALPETGGHVGFVAGWRGPLWAERQAARFLALYLTV